MDRTRDYRLRFTQQQQQQQYQSTSLATTIAYGVAFLYIVHWVLAYFDYPVLSPQELLWNALVYILPKQLLLDRGRRQELKTNGMLSQTHAAKSEALRSMLGIGGSAVMQSLPAEGLMRRASAFVKPQQPTPDAPAGLGNWDNSCYQNSVLQGLASLDSLKPYLRQRIGSEESNTTESLMETINKLSDPLNNGKQLWTPAKLKSMSSWQQQDAQEYFSKIMDELDKEAAKSLAGSKTLLGLESLTDKETSSAEGQSATQDASAKPTEQAETTTDERNPLDGLIAQRVTCTRCGFSEGLSMIPFNCLTVPLNTNNVQSIEDCLSEYTKLEEIESVECAKCTLLHNEKQLLQMLPAPPNYRSMDAVPFIESKSLALPPELRAQAFKRLRAIQEALENDDYADKTLSETCSIAKKARVSTTKTRQAVVGRAPKSLVVHVNRSVFDEMTGIQRKNYASVKYPAVLDLGQWMLRTGLRREHTANDFNGSLLDDELDAEGMTVDGSEEVDYRIKAVVTHYGRHENGHYICYRQHPVARKRAAQEDGDLDGVDSDSETPAQDSNAILQWWRLSDEDVSPVSEEDVLAQGGVFMLFYEREDEPERPARLETEPAAAAEAEMAGRLIEQDGQSEESVVNSPETNDARCSELDNATDEPLAKPSPIEEGDSAPTRLTAASIDLSSSETPSTSAIAQDEPQADDRAPTPAPQAWTKPSTSPVLMRTSRGRQASSSERDPFGGGNAFRAVAAT
ncbi:ubiquitin-specific protease ubp1 [Vermiconidia calcicola]|uniref:Ubiquitin-specific protease ubp1 n=1 Tax=Vermiconidia calcicola TaxID=1690605 RepID=A0ACC3MQC8_9PEZI|nr:ubiquitin-specific protease ubp1 [Vermiconidia calcicola]